MKKKVEVVGEFYGLARYLPMENESYEERPCMRCPKCKEKVETLSTFNDRRKTRRYREMWCHSCIKSYEAYHKKRGN